ncbi:MAG: heat-inducible transcription repressor HrcA [Candidatus Abyssobacteria bacterium SURF_17]|uniref:Heat-inducible transcription repressor HrcA n=1 Tax=Candidatus Abyssobacteria bacterium SURF_17 TaxID=2093361 RepID=A0A419EY54_9BACT|nr:MAG: heat-inducible transcription repressor HrcA [Candidatus Abyssubacteria bacterium SURF_17]
MKVAAPMNERQKDILQAIINTYITTAEAVGSRTVAKKIGYILSPASVRNVMSDLEEMGYVRQPHTSAGRVPTDTGYRCYVDSLMDAYEPDPEEQHRIEQFYQAKIKQIEDFMGVSSRLLAILTRYTAIVQTPKMDTERIKRVELVPLSSEKVLVILVTNVGDVKKNVAVLPMEMTGLEIEQLARFLNDKLDTLSLADARSLLGSFLDSEDVLDERLASLALEILEEVLSEEKPRDVYLDGMENIFDQPEFRNVDLVRPVLRVLDEKVRLNTLIEWCVAESDPAEVCIRIGSENPLDDVRSCSIVASPYRIGGRTTGAVGVIGPTRMHYSRVISLVALIADKLSHVLTEMSGGE